MEFFKEIVSIVNKNAIKRKDSMYSLTGKGKSNPYLRLFRALHIGKVKNDAEAASFLNFKKQDSNYRMFKSRFSAKLLNMLFFVDFKGKDGSVNSMAFFKCSRNVSNIKTLLLLGGRMAAIQLLLKTIKISIDFEFTETTIYCARMLKSIYALNGNNRQFEKYLIILKKHTAILAAEDEAIEFLDRMYLLFAKSSELKRHEGKKALDNATVVEKSAKKHKTKFLALNACRLSGMGYQVLENYQGALEAWKRMENLYLTGNKFDNRLRLGEANLNKLSCYLSLHDFENGEACVIKCRAYFKKGNNNWFTFMEYYFVLSMHSGKYEQGAEIIKETMSEPKFPHIAPHMQDKWKIYLAYNEAIKKLAGGNWESAFKENFKFSKFINEIITYSTDKRGYNISIQVVRVIWYLANNDYQSIIKMMDSLRRYELRYLRKNASYRSDVFVKMLIALYDADFEPMAAIDKTHGLLKLLTKVKKVDDMEILPYQDLWQLILGHLRKLK
jgi:hypothetical protein